MNDKPSVFLFPHVPKCAGRSVSSFLADRVPPGVGALIYSKEEQMRWSDPEKRVPAQERQALRILFGHKLPQHAAAGFKGRLIRQCGMLRDPVSYKVSLYNFYQSEPALYGVTGLSFARWYARSKHNSVSRFYLKSYFGLSSLQMRLMSPRGRFDFISRQFEDFWFVGDYRNCDAVMEKIGAELDLPISLDVYNKAPPGSLAVADLTDQMRERILRDNALDQALYDAWSRRLWNDKPETAAGSELAKHWTWQ